MTGVFYDFFKQNQNQITKNLICNSNTESFGENIPSGFLHFDLGEFNGYSAIMKIVIRRHSKQTSISFSVEFKNANSHNSKTMSYEDKIYAKEKITLFLKNLKLENIDICADFINHPLKNRNITRDDKHFNDVDINGTLFSFGYAINHNSIMIRFLMDNTDDLSVLSDLRFIDNETGHFDVYQQRLHTVKNFISYEHYSSNTDFLSSIDKDWKLQHLFSDPLSTINILKLNLPEKEEKELFNLSFAF